MQKRNNDLSKNTLRAKSLHAAQGANRIKNYPPRGRCINPHADSDPLLTDGFFRIHGSADDLHKGSLKELKMVMFPPHNCSEVTGAINKDPRPSGLLDGGPVPQPGRFTSPCL